MTMRTLVDPGSMPGASIQERFERFHRLNPWVYTQLEAMTAEYVSAGRRRIGLKMLVEVLRWHYDLSTSGDAFKISNNYTSRYARELLSAHPEWRGMFVLKPLRAE